MRGCDWYGSSVNVAARLAAEARPNEPLVSATTRDAAGAASRPLGAPRDVALRGLERPVSTWRLSS